MLPTPAQWMEAGGARMQARGEQTSCKEEDATSEDTDSDHKLPPSHASTPPPHHKTPMVVSSLADLSAATESSPTRHDARQLSAASSGAQSDTTASSSQTPRSHVRQVSTDSSSSASSSSTPPSVTGQFHFTRPSSAACMDDVPTSARDNDGGPIVAYHSAPCSPPQSSSMRSQSKSIVKTDPGGGGECAMTDTVPAAAHQQHGHVHIIPAPSSSSLTFAPTMPTFLPFAPNSSNFVTLLPNQTFSVQQPMARMQHMPIASGHTQPAPQLNSASTAAALKRGQGFSCHHCKTHKMPEMLLFCSNQSKKGPGKKRCRKKYCGSYVHMQAACLTRLYGHPTDLPLNETVGFQCPACLGSCVCAGCERKTVPAASSANGAATADGTDGTGATSGSSCGAPSVSPVPLLAVGSSPSPSRERGQTKPTTPQGKPPGKKRRTSIDSGSSGMADELKPEADEMASQPIEDIAMATPLLLHGRRHSGENMIPSVFHMPHASSLPFTVSPSHSQHPLPPRSGSNSNAASPRQSMTMPTSSNRMIHLPAFSLHSPITNLHPVIPVGTFSSTVQQSVATATTAAAQVIQLTTSSTMDCTSGSEPSADTTTSSSCNSRSTSPTQSRRPSAFSPIRGPVLPMLETDMPPAPRQEVNSASTQSPAVSPSLFKRLLLNNDIPATSSSMVDRVHRPATATAAPTQSDDPMKVLANVACTVNQQNSLPPTHPPPMGKSESSPKLSYPASSMFFSPTHPFTLPPPAMSNMPTSSLASISAMKAQHAMEVQCLLHQQQQQLSELELRMKELDQHHLHAHSAMMHQQFQQHAQQQQQQLASKAPSAS